MYFSFIESFCDISHFSKLAPAVEKAGFDGFCVPDSIAYPKETSAKYPYIASGDRSFIDQPMLDPFIAVTHMATLTEKLEFMSFVVKLAVRNPVLAAKSATSVAALTNNRFKFGVGLSPWPHDFDLCGQPWAKRGKRLEEMLDIVRGLATGEFFEYHGDFYDFEPVRMSPAPTKPMPILLGGHVDAALRRAVLRGDGWLHAGGDADELDPLLDRLQEIRVEEGAQNKPFEIHVVSQDAYSLDGIKRLEDKGVTGVIVGFRNLYDPSTAGMPVEDKIAALSDYAENIIHKL